MSTVYRSMVTLALAHAAIAAEWTENSFSSEAQCNEWKEATKVNFDCDADWNCKMKQLYQDRLGNDAAAIANQEKNVSAGGDDWRWKCDPSFLLVLQKHALQKKLQEAVAADGSLDMNCELDRMVQEANCQADCNGDAACSEDCSRDWGYSCQEDMGKDAFVDFVQRYVDFEEVKQWADDTNAVVSELQERQQQEAQEWAETVAKQIEEGINGILRQMVDDLAEKSGEANERLAEELEALIAEEDAMIDQMDEMSWEMRKIKQVKHHVIQAATATDSEVSACDQFKIEQEKDGDWSCNATTQTCEATDKYWDLLVGADLTAISEKDLEEMVDALEFAEGFINRMYDLACNPNEQAWVIDWDLKKKELKKRTQVMDECAMDAAMEQAACFARCGMDDTKCQDMCAQDYSYESFCNGSNAGDKIEDAIEDFVERYVDEEAAQAWLEETEASWTEMADRHEQETAAQAQEIATQIQGGLSDILSQMADDAADKMDELNEKIQESLEELNAKETEAIEQMDDPVDWLLKKKQASKKVTKPAVAAKNPALRQKGVTQMSLATAIATNKAQDAMNQYFAYGAGAVTFACVASLALFCSKRKQMTEEDEGFHRV